MFKSIAIALLACSATVFARPGGGEEHGYGGPGQKSGHGGYGPGGYGPGGYGPGGPGYGHAQEQCHTNYITSTCVTQSPTTKFYPYTTYVPFTTYKKVPYSSCVVESSVKVEQAYTTVTSCHTEVTYKTRPVIITQYSTEAITYTRTDVQKKPIDVTKTVTFTVTSTGYKQKDYVTSSCITGTTSQVYNVPYTSTTVKAETVCQTKGGWSW